MIQTQFLNWILKNKDFSPITLNNINEDYFSEYKNEFKFIKNHYETYHNVCDYESFIAKFPKFEVIDVNESSDFLVNSLKDDYNTRKLASTFQQIKSLLLVDKVDEAVTLYKDIGDNLNKNVSLSCVDILRDTSRYNDYVERTKDFSKFYIKTGFKELDDIIGGLDREEELGVIVARPNVGKSQLILKFALASVEQGLNVGLYSGEMSERKVGYRFDTLCGHINNGAITHGNISYEPEYKKYIEELPNKFTGCLKILTPKMISGPADVNALRTFIERENLDILFVDQLTLLEDQRKGKSVTERMGNISKDLKNLQVMIKKPIISVSQLNREKNEEGIDLLDLAQIGNADRIGQDATLVIGVSRDKKDTSLLKLHLMKSRDSEVGKILSYHVDFNLGQFTYIPEEDEDTEQTYEIDDEVLVSRYESEDSSYIADGDNYF